MNLVPRMLAILLLAVVALPGCTFYHSAPMGMYSRDALNDDLTNVDPEQAAEWRKTAMEADQEPREVGRTKVYTSNDGWGIFSWNNRISYRETPPKYRTNVLNSRASNWILFNRAEVGTYDAETGIQYGLTKTDAYVAALYTRHLMIRPGDVPGTQPEAMGALTAHPEVLEYSRYKGTALIWGLVAWGSKNGSSYLQVLWLPIRTGDAEPKTDKAAPEAEKKEAVKEQENKAAE